MKKSGNGFILIFGTFNPITNAHIRMGILAKELYPEDRVIYIPSRDRFLSSWKQMKKSQILGGRVRMELMRKALYEYGFEVDDIEINTGISGKTVDTIEAIHKKYDRENERADIKICMGTDKLTELHTWYKGIELVADNRFIIIDRNGEDAKRIIKSIPEIAEYEANFTEVSNSDYTGISSSMIRAFCRDGQYTQIREYVPECVYEYLTENREIYR